MIQVARTSQWHGPRNFLGPVGEPELDRLPHPEQEVAGPLGHCSLAALEWIGNNRLLNIVVGSLRNVIGAFHVSPLASVCSNPRQAARAREEGLSTDGIN